MRIRRRFRESDSFITLFNSVCRSRLAYAPVVWNDTTVFDICVHDLFFETIITFYFDDTRVMNITIFRGFSLALTLMCW